MKAAAIVILVIMFLVAPFFIFRAFKLDSIRQVDFTITKLPNRDLQYNSNGNKNTYANLVYTDKGTFENTDSWFPWKQNSSDVYAGLEQGKKYSCEVAGWRVGLFSSYPDIIRCKAQ